MSTLKFLLEEDNVEYEMDIKKYWVDLESEEDGCKVKEGDIRVIAGHLFKCWFIVKRAKGFFGCHRYQSCHWRLIELGRENFASEEHIESFRKIIRKKVAI